MNDEKLKSLHLKEQSDAAAKRLARALIDSPDWPTFWQRYDARCLTHLEMIAVRGLLASVFADAFQDINDEREAEES